MLILQGRYTADWWETTAHQEHAIHSRCTKEEILRALNMTLAISAENYNLDQISTVRAFSNSVSHYISSVTA